MLTSFKAPPVSALIFDLDGTLLDTGRDLSNSINHARETFGLPPLPESILTGFIGDGVNRLIERAFNGTGITLEQAKPHFTSHYQAHMLDNTRPYPGVAETLPGLPYKKAVVTNKSAEFVPGLLTRFNLSGYFDLIVGGNTLPVFKPDPLIVDHVAEKLGVSKREIVVIGDHKTDLLLAKNAGIRCVFCNYGIGRDDGMKPTARIDAFSELKSIFC